MVQCGLLLIQPPRLCIRMVFESSLCDPEIAFETNLFAMRGHSFIPLDTRRSCQFLLPGSISCHASPLLPSTLPIRFLGILGLFLRNQLQHHVSCQGSCAGHGFIEITDASLTIRNQCDSTLFARSGTSEIGSRNVSGSQEIFSFMFTCCL